MVRKLKLVLYPSLVLAVFLVGLCRASWGQGDADLEAPGLAPFPTTLARGATLFQNVRIFDGKSEVQNPRCMQPRIGRIVSGTFLVAPSDRFKSFQAQSRLVGYCVVLVAGSSVRTLKTPFAASF